MARILVVDDDETTLVIFRAFLSRAGYEVETARDGIEGVEKAAILKPDLIILDINMPKMSGFEAARHLKEKPETKGIPIFILTSLKQDHNIEKAYGLGAEDYITKPANIEHVKLKIKKLLEKK